jgi:Zn-dependent protease
MPEQDQDRFLPLPSEAERMADAARLGAEGAALADGAEPLVAVIVVDPSVPMEDAVLYELESIRNPKRNWTQAIILLVISVVAFTGMHMGRQPLIFTAMLVGVLFLHELGHYLGMVMFGYRNVRMFFIPFFGAAVSGHKTSAKGYQEAIVTLLGPLPGLCLAPILFGVAFLPNVDWQQRQLLVQAAALMGFLNGFNLLPIYPLDGGRLLNQLLFAHNRYLEGVFQVLAAAALIGLGAMHGGFFYFFLGGWLLIGVNPSFQVNTIAPHIAGLLGEHLPDINEEIPLPIFRAILLAVQARLPGAKTAKSMAVFVFRVWEKMHIQPPGTVATAALLMAYLLGVGLSLPWVAPFVLRMLHR